MKDLIVLVADKNMEHLILGLLPRIPHIEKTRDFTFEVFVHPYRDPGVYTEGHEFLRSMQQEYSKCIVILDREGSGQEKSNREQIEDTIESNLNTSGWNGRNAAIVVDPELENWVWVNEPRLKAAISWEFQNSPYDWLEQDGRIPDGAHKPNYPKEAFELILRKCNTPRSSSVYSNISTAASYRYCQDPAFLKLISQLKYWFLV